MTVESTGASGDMPEAPARPHRVSLVLVALTFWLAFDGLSVADTDSDPRWLWLRLARVVVLALSAVIAFGREPGGAMRVLGGSPRPHWFGRTMLVEFVEPIGLAASMLLASTFMSCFVDPGIRTPLSALLSGPDATPSTLRGQLDLVVVAPICEEIFFRGLLLRALVQRMPRGWAVLLSALAFGSLHEAFTPQFVSGLVYGWVALEAGSLWPVMLAHAFGNLLAERSVIGAVFALQSAFVPPAAPAWLQASALAVFLLGLFAAGLVILTGRRGNRAAQWLVVAAALGCLLAVPHSPAAQDASPTAEDGLEFVEREHVVEVRHGPKAAFPLPFGTARFPAAPGDTLVIQRFRQIAGPVGADTIPDQHCLRMKLAGRVREVELLPMSLGPIRVTDAIAYDAWRWFGDGDQVMELLGSGQSVSFGPKLRRGPWRVVETRRLEGIAGARASALAIVWVPFREHYLGFEAGVADTNEVRAVLEALDARVRRIQIRKGERPGERSPGQGPYRAWLCDLGRDGNALRWETGALPNALYLLGALIVLAVAFARRGRHRGASASA